MTNAMQHEVASRNDTMRDPHESSHSCHRGHGFFFGIRSSAKTLIEDTDSRIKHSYIHFDVLSSINTDSHLNTGAAKRITGERRSSDSANKGER
jgi:hypothetical protein